MALLVKNPPASAEDLKDIDMSPGSGRSPGGRHGNPFHHSCWENPWMEEPGGLQSTGLQRVRDD